MIIETMMRETILDWAGIEEEELKEEEKQLLRKIIKPYQTKITAYTEGERRAMTKANRWV